MSKSGGAFQFFGGRRTSRGQCLRGGGVLVNVLKAEGDDVTRHKLQAIYMYSIMAYYKRAGKTNLFHYERGRFHAFNT